MELEGDIPAADRHVVAAALARILADTALLAAKTRGFRWNAGGLAGLALSPMLRREERALRRAQEPLARRLRVLGHPAPASLADLLALSGLREERGVPGALPMLAQLLADHRAVVATLRHLRPCIEDMGDVASARLLGARLAAHEEAAAALATLDAVAWGDAAGPAAVLPALEAGAGFLLD